MIVSVDCWGTLIKSSPTFNEEKIRLTKKYFPVVRDEWIKQCFSFTKKDLNSFIENSGGSQPKAFNIFTYLFSKLNGGYDNFKFIDEFYDEYQKLAITHPPVIYSDETIEFIEALAIRARLVLSSNTMFISGRSLGLCLENAGVYRFFESALYSDILEVAKPNKKMYGRSDFHIGDNPLTDGIGASCAGSKPIIINSSNLTIKDAYNIIIQGK